MPAHEGKQAGARGSTGERRPLVDYRDSVDPVDLPEQVVPLLRA